MLVKPCIASSNCSAPVTGELMTPCQIGINYRLTQLVSLLQFYGLAAIQVAVRKVMSAGTQQVQVWRGISSTGAISAVKAGWRNTITINR